eukprot:520824-Prorocentrum_minimum.AAC.1
MDAEAGAEVDAEAGAEVDADVDADVDDDVDDDVELAGAGTRRPSVSWTAPRGCCRASRTPPATPPSRGPSGGRSPRREGESAVREGESTVSQRGRNQADGRRRICLRALATFAVNCGGEYAGGRGWICGRRGWICGRR